MEEQAALAPHVLALDDDAAIRELIADYLGANDLRVTTVASGRELDAALTRATFDVVILDLRLPGEDGMQIARRLRETSAVPILMLTGRVEEADRVMGLELGADDYLTKPFSTRASSCTPRWPTRSPRCEAIASAAGSSTSGCAA